VKNINFHPALKDIENMFFLFLLSVRMLSDPEMQSLIKTKNSINDGYEIFNEILEKVNQSMNLKIEIHDRKFISRLDLSGQMVFLGKAMAVLTYDYLLSSPYNNVLSNEDQFIFLKFIRNGAAHHNKFNLKDEKGEWKVAEGEIFEWDGLKISRSLHGKKVFNDFITLFNVFSLAKHFSDRLKSIDLAPSH